MMKRATKSSSAELSLISAIRGRAGAARGELRMGIGDDCAILRPRADEDIVVTTDLSLERVHFRREWHPAESVGHRCLARGLSDLAAMGARPVAAFLSLALPGELTRKRGRGANWMDRFLDGFFRLAELHNVSLAGGDLAQSPEVGDGVSLVTADIILLGAVVRGRAMLRSGARVGDRIYVTGSLGGAGLNCWLWNAIRNDFSGRTRMRSILTSIPGPGLMWAANLSRIKWRRQPSISAMASPLISLTSAKNRGWQQRWMPLCCPFT